jgi:CO/xanthine dehydrogenase Mo-binding subunit
VEKAFKDAHFVVEREFYTGTVHQGYIEPQNATALWHEDDQITVWCSTQGAFPVRAQTAGIVHVPVSKVRVVPTEIGGGFGGKLGVYLEPVAAMLSKKSGHRPVRMTMSRDEVLKATGPTSGSHITVKMAVDAHGRLVAGKTMLAYEAGAYPGSPVGAAMGVIFSPYRLPNVLIDGYDVVVNKPKAAAYRAPGGTNAAYAAEVVIDELAGLLKMDPLEFRRLNAVREGDRRADGPVFQKIGCIETLEAIMFSNHYHSELPKPSSPTGKVGRGVARGFWFNWGGKSSATAAVNPNGTVSLVEGSTDIGGSRTSFAMQLAEALGITAEEVIPTVVDTNSVGYNDSTGGSRTTFASGLVAFELARKIKAELCQRAALHWEVKAEDVKVDGAMYTCGDMKIEFHDLVKKLDETGGPINVAATGESTQYGGAFGTHVVDVEVDTDTGKTQILRYTAAQDVGRAIHPSYVEGQIQEYVYDKDGHLLNANFLDYRMPTALDLPMIDVLIVEVPNPAHPFGVRGVGEVPIVPPAPAVANAIANATGVRMTVLPMSPRRVLEALGKI